MEPVTPDLRCADADSTAEALVEVGGQPHVPVKKKGSRKR
jgi:hypothetical protein